MNILVVSEYGQSAGLASRLEKEGNNVKMLLTRGGRVFFDTDTVAPDFAVEVAIDGHFDIVAVDSAANGRLAERVRKGGPKVVGGSTWSEAIFGDNGYLKSVLSSVGLPTEVAPSPESINLYVSGWFNGSKFTSRYTSLVYRRMMVGGKGKDLGCVGTLSNHRNRSGKPYSLVLKPLESVLRKVNHRGPVHAHVIVTPTAYAVTELNTDLNHPLSMITTEGIRATATELLASCVNDGGADSGAKTAWTSSVLIAYPPFPYHNELEVEGTPRMEQINAGVLKHLYPIGMKLLGNDYHIVGGAVCYAMGGGDSFTEAIRRMYRTVTNIEVPNCMYRLDVGRNVQGHLYNLEKWGWLV
jgi:phosphoribosylamine-glycine ligase